MRLSAEQIAASTTEADRAVTIAPPGSGKTSTLVARLSWLLHKGVPGDRILATTFTRAAAKEVTERLEVLASDGQTLPEVRTTHSWCQRLCRAHAAALGLQPDFTVYDDIDSTALWKLCGSLQGYGNRRVATLQRTDPVRRMYLQMIRQSNGMDFGDLEIGARELLKMPRVRARWRAQYRDVLVDEYQDTNPLQAELVDALRPERAQQRLYIVGDPRQSIYGFRGAAPGMIEALAQMSAWTTHHLTLNWRSLPRIVEVANACAPGSWPDMVAARTGQPGIVRAVSAPTNADAVLGVLPTTGHTAVLGRRWRDLAAVSSALRAAGHDVRYYGQAATLWNQRIGRTIARLLQLAGNPADDVMAALLYDATAAQPGELRDLEGLRVTAWRKRQPLLDALAEQHPNWQTARTVIRERSRPARIASALLDVLYPEAVETPDTQTALGVIDAFDDIDGFREWWISRSVQDPEQWDECGPDTVHVMTVHAAKGLEFDNVVGIGAVAGAYPYNPGDAERTAEDRRVWYVQATRARNQLFLTVPERHQTRPAHPSPWLQAMGIAVEDIHAAAV